MNRAVEHREVEFKFRIPEGAPLDVRSVIEDSGVTLHPLPPRSMSATYFDTANLSLLRWGVTLRRRTGGGDDGWHVKLPVGADSTVRDEIRIERHDEAVPFELAAIVSPLLRRQELLPLAEVLTERTPFVVRDRDDVEVLEIVDDRVRVDGPHVPSQAHFREVEVELLTDSSPARTMAETVCAALRTAGAVPSSVSKAAQALGRRVGDPPDVPVIPFPSADGTAVDALKAIFSRYVRDLILADVAVRRDAPDSVHRMRVACRRLRSALKSFGSLLDEQVVSFLREELQWLGTELGHVRDTEVQIDALATGIENEQARDFAVNALNRRLRAARSSVLAALRSDRHDFLLEDLISLVSEPPASARAFTPAGPALSECVREPWRRLRTSVKRVDGTARSWHRVRLRAKQARYALEAAAPILGEEYARLGRSLGWVTDTLGSRQDAQISIHTLETLASDAPGPIAYEFGLRSARFQTTGEHDVLAFSDRWPNILTQAAKVGLR